MEIRGQCLSAERHDLSVLVRILDYQSRCIVYALGTAYQLSIGDKYYLAGEYQSDGIFRFYAIRRYSDSRQESINLLTGISGISEQLAKKIVFEIGDDIFAPEDFEKQKRCLMNIEGIGQKKADDVLAFLCQDTNDKMFQLLSDFQIPYSKILSIIAKATLFEDEIIRNPYELMKYDISFEQCDTFAIKNQIDAWDINRISALIKDTIGQMLACGDTRMEYKKFITMASKHSSRRDKLLSVPPELVEIILYSQGEAIVYQEEEQKYIASFRLNLCESLIAKHLSRIQFTRQRIRFDIEPSIKKIEGETGVRFNEEQRRAFQSLVEGGVSILIGGPGTGKTTTIGGIVKVYLEMFPQRRVLLTAPTGRAANRIAEVTGEESKTLHQALKLKWYHSNKVNPLNYDFVVIDEMSMCDTELFSLFVRAVQSGTSVLLCGDYNQIPSVGPGQVLRDLIESGNFLVFQLVQIIRQSQNSLIPLNAQAILNGEPLIHGTDFSIDIVKNDDEISRILRKKLKSGQLPQLLCPIKKTEVGTCAQNLLVQSGKGWAGKCIWVEGICLYEGDRIIINKTNYEAGLINGEVGSIQRIHNNMVSVQFYDRNINIEWSKLDCSLAYSLTFHKVQGTECKEVLIILPSSSRGMASRELLYTAVTRASSKVVIVAIKTVLDAYLAAADRSLRQCGLKSKLQHQTNRRKNGRDH